MKNNKMHDDDKLAAKNLGMVFAVLGVLMVILIIVANMIA